MKSVAIVSFFPGFSPPRSGGELRLHHIAVEVARAGFDVEMVSPTFGDAPQETIAHCEGFREHRFPKSNIYNKAHHALDRLAGFRECSGLVCSYVSRHHAALRSKARELADRADVVTHESPFLAPLVPRRRRPGQLFVYNSYNVESRMARDMFGTGPAGKIATGRIRRMEKNLLREADVVFSCSREDSDYFVLDYGIDRSKIVEIPNGVDTQAIRPIADPADRTKARDNLRLAHKRPVAFFIGSFHPPNIEAAQYIIEELGPKSPEVFFFIAGKVCEAFRPEQTGANVHLMGLIDEAQKNDLQAAADIALNPIVSGSGTNLKMLEYFAGGLAVLATPKGARGLMVEDGREAIVKPLSDFPAALETLAADANLRKRMGAEGRSHVERHFDWRRIGEKVADVYTMKTGRRALMICDYPITPAESGGPKRVEAVAERIAAEGRPVTVLTMTTENEGRRISHGGSREELCVPRSAIQRTADALLSTILGSSADDVSALLFGRRLSRDFRNALRRESRFAEDVLFCHPYLAGFLRDLPRNANLWFDSHNSEYLLKETLYRRGRLGGWALRRVERAERVLCESSRGIFCVSTDNKRDLVRLDPAVDAKGIVCPNGVKVSIHSETDAAEKLAMRRRFGLGVRPLAIFVGSEHLPNRDAAFFIVDVLATDHPRVLFLLVGSVCNHFRDRELPENVMAMGVVEEGVKNAFLRVSDVALNPMQRGSGTSLKLFEYLAAGLPVLTTELGARGLNPAGRNAVEIAEIDAFSDTLKKLAQDIGRRAELASEARKIAAIQYDWDVTLGPLGERFRTGESGG